MTTDTHSSLNTPPGNLGFPLIGETIAFLRDGDFAKKRYEKYGSIFKTHLFNKPTIVLKGAEANQFVLSNEHKYFASAWPPSTRILLGSLSLAIQRGHEHRQRRKLMAQAFKPRVLRGYIHTIETITHQYLQQWEKQEEFTWYPQLRNYTFDIAAQLFMGLENGSNTKLRSLFETWSNGLFTLPFPFPWTKFGRA